MTTFGSAQITTQQVIETTAAVRGVRAEEARKIATARAWLDHSGEVTPAGQEMVVALGDQGSSRSVFR